MTDITADRMGVRPAGGVEYPIKRIIFASSLGTMIEWYDFYIFGSLAVVMSELMFPKGDPAWALIKTWALFATGFLVRPFGALVFGRIGDLIGRKYAFLVTLTVMGLSTFLIVCLPTYATIGLLAPTILLFLRLLEGLALGGEYGAAAGQGIDWYTGQVYALAYIQGVRKLDIVKASIVVAIADLLDVPFFAVFGSFSDKIGRLKLIMAGNLIAAVTYLPIYLVITNAA